MGVLEKVGDRWMERRPQKRLQRDATQRAPILTNGQQCLAQNKKKITDTPAVSTSLMDSGVLIHRTGRGEPALRQG